MCFARYYPWKRPFFVGYSDIGAASERIDLMHENGTVFPDWAMPGCRDPSRTEAGATIPACSR